MTEDIKFLNDYQHARLRTEMYLGSRVMTGFKFPILDDLKDTFSMEDVTFIPAALTAFREALDNHLDEMSFTKHGSIEIFYDGLTIRTCDDGRGIPIDIEPETGMHIATRVVSETKAGRNFGERGEQAGTNGLGISVVNYCSRFFQLTVWRDKKMFTQTFEESDEELIIKAPKINESNMRTGTQVAFALSPKVFGEEIDGGLPVHLVKSVVYFVAYTNPHIKFKFNGEDIKTSKDVKKNLFGNEKVIEFKFEDENNRGSYFVKMTDGDTNFFSFVNNVPAYNGGTHDDEIKYHFPRQLLEALKKESKKRKLNPNKNDVLDNLMFIGAMKVKAPNFDSQSKTRLTNKEAKNAIFDCLTKDTDWQKFIKDNPELINEIYKRCAARTNKQDASEVDKEEKALKKLKIAKLLEANSKDRKKCILFITEGDSAKGGLNDARDPSIHAVMPLRGKIKNVFDAKPSEALASEIIKQLCAAVGLTPGKPVNWEQLRYGKVYVMADADEDGQGSICPLVISLFYRYWPELFTQKEAFIHIFSTPLIIAEKAKERKYFYNHNVDEFDPSKFKGWSIRRAKGLGSLQTENFRDHLENPVSIPVFDDELIGHVLNLLYNNMRSDDRKLFMEIPVDEVMTKMEEQGSNWNPTINELDV